MKPKIFVQIAAYRDPECAPTIRDLYARAAHPERIFVGLCWQYTPGVDDHLLTIDDAVAPRVRVVKVETAKSQGACWARSQVQQLLKDEDYTLQIDSHMRFEPGWDDKLIDMLAQCPSEKAVITAYPAGYTPPDNKGASQIHLLTAVNFDPNDGMLRLIGRPVGPNGSRPIPIQGMFISGNFLFGKSQMVHEVPYDPYLYFYGEESTLAVRLWTHGYDIYHPNENVIFHYYKKAGDANNRVHWSDHKYWRWLNERAMARYHFMLCGMQPKNPAYLIDMDRYGLGTARSLKEFQETAGVDFRRRLLSPAARNCEFFGDPKKRELETPAGEGPPNTGPEVSPPDIEPENPQISTPPKQQDRRMDISWLGWVHGNLRNNCDRRQMRELLLDAGFPLDTIRAVMGVEYTDEPMPKAKQ